MKFVEFIDADNANRICISVKTIQWFTPISFKEGEPQTRIECEDHVIEVNESYDEVKRLIHEALNER